MTYRISVLDQSLRYNDRSAAQVLADTVAMARHADALGYHRYWVSEHHAVPFICGSSPEVLLGALGASTRRIRIGAGGVLLPHYSAFKVAENFSVLSNLFPGRVDLGIGRAVGGEMAAAYALSRDGKLRFDNFPEQIETLQGYLDGVLSHPPLSPEPAGDIPVHLLGTSSVSARLAGALGLPYALSLFIEPQADPRIGEIYRAHFRPRRPEDEPHLILAVTALAHEDAGYARRLQSNAFANLVNGQRNGGRAKALSLAESDGFELTREESIRVGQLARTSAFGTIDTVCERLDTLAESYGADELMVTANTIRLEDRKLSLSLIAETQALAERAA